MEVFDVYVNETGKGPVAKVDVSSGGIRLRGVPVWREPDGSLRVGAITEQGKDKAGKPKWYERAKVSTGHHAAIIAAARSAIEARAGRVQS